MHLFLSVICFSVFCAFNAKAQAPSISYGDNAATGKYITLNGVKHYYEVYGQGKPLLLIHGNSTGIKGWSAQVEYFSKKYKVYAIDCRGRGKSELGKDTLSYIQQAKDMNAFITTLQLDSVMVVGKSDGGIIAIMMGIYFPQHIKKIVSFSANMCPDSNALYPQTVTEVHNERLHADSMLALKDKTQNWYLVQQRNRMMEFQPNITAEDLHRIAVPVLVISSDRDVIKEEHTLFIYKNIPMADLCFIPGETHHVPKENSALFNLLVDKFLTEPFKGFSSRF